MINFFKTMIAIFSQKPREVEKSKINLEILQSAQDPKDKKAIITGLDKYICRLCMYGSKLEKLTDHQKVFYFNQELEREVGNGGFYQFYYNSSGNYVNEVIDSLVTIGASKAVEIVKKANSQFANSKVPTDREERLKVLEQIKEKANVVWEKLYQDFCNYEEDLNTLNLEFVKNHLNEFIMEYER